MCTLHKHRAKINVFAVHTKTKITFFSSKYKARNDFADINENERMEKTEKIIIKSSLNRFGSFLFASSLSTSSFFVLSSPFADQLRICIFGFRFVAAAQHNFVLGFYFSLIFLMENNIIIHSTLSQSAHLTNECAVRAANKLKNNSNKNEICRKQKWIFFPPIAVRIMWNINVYNVQRSPAIKRMIKSV